MTSPQSTDPDAPPQSAAPPPICIDALNVAYWCGAPPSLRLPIILLAQLLADGREALLFFDASARYQLEHEAGIYARLLTHTRHVIEAPSGRSADQLLLRQARSTGACIVSRDHYRDHRKRYRKLIDDPARMISGGVRDGRLQLPALALSVALPGSADAAWELLALDEQRLRRGDMTRQVLLEAAKCQQR